MAESSSSTPVNVPLFKGDNFNLWSLKMKTIFHSKRLWKIVENGFNEKGEDEVVYQRREVDASALYVIQQGLDETENTHPNQ